MAMLMVSIFCFAAPLAAGYGLHAWRKAPQRGLAWAGFGLSLVVFIPFVLAMVGAVLGLVERVFR